MFIFPAENRVSLATRKMRFYIVWWFLGQRLIKLTAICVLIFIFWIGIRLWARTLFYFFLIFTVTFVNETITSHSWQSEVVFWILVLWNRMFILNRPQFRSRSLGETHCLWSFLSLPNIWIYNFQATIHRNAAQIITWLMRNGLILFENFIIDLSFAKICESMFRGVRI